jgi:arylsulfatase A-like enzyme
MNIIYVVCHDLGRHLGCYGRQVHSPNIDAFASQSVRFDRAFCQTAVCSPSRAACLSGLPAHQNGMMGLAHFGWRFFDGVKTIVDYCNEAGIETVHCGFSHEGEELQSRYQIDFEVDWRCHTVEAAVDDAIAYLKGRRKQKRKTPFYLNLGTTEVHRSVWSKDTDAKGFPSRFRQVYGGPVPDEEAFVPPPTPDIPYTHEMFARFASAIRYFDQQIGRLVATIDELGYNKDTLVVFTTDHGMVDLRGKGTLYDRGTEIALMARPPRGMAKPDNCEHLVSNLDVTPTLLEALGITVPEHLRGRSFWRLIAGRGDYEPNERIFQEWNFGGPQDDYSPIRVLRENRYKLMRHYGPNNFDQYYPDEINPEFTREQLTHRRYKNYGPGYLHPERMTPEVQLFDLMKDPHERHNLAEDPAHAERVTAMAAVLHDWMAQTDDHLLRREIPKVPQAPGFHFPENPPTLVD